MGTPVRVLPEQWRDPIEQWETRLRADGFSPQTVRDRSRAVRRAAHAFAGCPWDVTSDLLGTYSGQQPWSDQTRSAWLRGLRLFYEFAVTRGWTATVPTPARCPSSSEEPPAMPWQVALATWAGWCTASGWSPGTIKMRLYWLRRFSSASPELGPWEVQIDDLVAWLGSLKSDVATRRAARSSLRSFYRWATTTGRVPADPTAELPAIRTPEASPRPAPEAALAAALRAADSREWLMLMLGATVGLRRAEIAAVHTEDLVLYPDGWSLRVVGKGGRVRDMPIHEDLARALRACPAGHVFPGAMDGHLSPAYVGKLISRLLPDGLAAHTLRHRYATQAYSQARDILAVRELMGHTNVRTTQIYTRVPDGARRAAAMAAAGLAI